MQLSDQEHEILAFVYARRGQGAPTSEVIRASDVVGGSAAALGRLVELGVLSCELQLDPDSPPFLYDVADSAKAAWLLFGPGRRGRAGALAAL